MKFSEDRIAAISDEFRRAAVGLVSWEKPLNDMIDLLGMRSGQLVAFGRDSLIPLNMMTRMVDEAAAEFVEIDGGNPEVNSKVRVGLTRPELVVLDEADYDTDGDRRKSPEFAAWMDRHDIGYCCVSTLVRTEDSLVGLAALQSASGPPLNDEAKRAFGVLSAAARSAVLLRESIEEQGLNLLTPAFDGVGMAVAICDITGRIRSMTPSAEEIVSKQRFGRLKDGEFRPHNRRERELFAEGLRTTIQSWAFPEEIEVRPCVLSSRDGEKLVVEFLKVPSEHGFSFAAAALIVFRVPSSPAERQAQIARTLFALTATETRTAESVLLGKSPQQIAAETGTSVGTVRNHIHRMLAKAECSSQIEFVARLNNYLT